MSRTIERSSRVTLPRPKRGRPEAPASVIGFRGRQAVDAAAATFPVLPYGPDRNDALRHRPGGLTRVHGVDETVLVGDPEPCMDGSGRELISREVFPNEAPYVDQVGGLVGYWVPKPADLGREVRRTVGRVPAKVDEMRLVIAPGMVQLRVIEHTEFDDDEFGLDG